MNRATFLLLLCACGTGTDTFFAHRDQRACTICGGIWVRPVDEPEFVCPGTTLNDECYLQEVVADPRLEAALGTAEHVVTGRLDVGPDGRTRFVLTSVE